MSEELRRDETGATQDFIILEVLDDPEDFTVAAPGPDPDIESLREYEQLARDGIIFP